MSCGVFLLDSVNDVLNVDMLSLVELFRKSRCPSFIELFHEYPVCGGAGSPGFKAAGLAAMAYLVIVQEREVTDLAGKSRLAI